MHQSNDSYRGHSGLSTQLAGRDDGAAGRLLVWTAR
jgi:hypothetical protein